MSEMMHSTGKTQILLIQRDKFKIYCGGIDMNYKLYIPGKDELESVSNSQKAKQMKIKRKEQKEIEKSKWWQVGW